MDSAVPQPRFFSAVYDLNSIPAFLSYSKIDPNLPDVLKLDLFMSLNNSAVKSGTVNFVTDFQTLKSTNLADLTDGLEATVTQVHADWILLNDQFIIGRTGTEGIEIGTEVRIKKSESAALEIVVLKQRQGKVSLKDLKDRHYLYYPVREESVDVDSYPETIGEERIRMESLKLLKPYNTGFQRMVEELKEEFSSWRKSRGDGNCYYRAIAFSYLEHLCRVTTDLKELVSFYMQLFLQLGVYRLNNFQDSFDQDYICVLTRLWELINIKEVAHSAVEQLEYIYLKDPEFDRSMIRVVKLAVSNYLRDHRDEFQSFESRPLESVIAEVLRDGQESEGIVFNVVARLFDIVIVHVMLHHSGVIHREEYRPENSGKKAVVCLLYRHGHYDIMYTLQADFLDRYNFENGGYTGFEVEGMEDFRQLYRELV